MRVFDLGGGGWKDKKTRANTHWPQSTNNRRQAVPTASLARVHTNDGNQIVVRALARASDSMYYTIHYCIDTPSV